MKTTTKSPLILNCDELPWEVQNKHASIMLHAPVKETTETHLRGAEQARFNYARTARARERNHKLHEIHRKPLHDHACVIIIPTLQSKLRMRIHRINSLQDKFSTPPWLESKTDYTNQDWAKAQEQINTPETQNRAKAQEQVHTHDTKLGKNPRKG